AGRSRAPQVREVVAVVAVLPQRDEHLLVTYEPRRRTVTEALCHLRKRQADSAQLTQRVGHQLTVSTNARQGRTAARPSPSRGPLACEMPARWVLARPVPPREAMARSLLMRPILERHQSGREHHHPGTDERSWWPRPAASSPWRTSSRRRDEARPLGEAPARD